MQIRVLRLFAVALVLLIGSALHAQEVADRHEFSIPAQPLANALIEYSRQAGVQVLTSGAHIGNARSPGVNGQLSLSRALDRLLEGTGLASEFTD